VVQQQATATDSSTVWQAGRDIITGNVFSGSFARLIDAWIPPDTVFDEAQISQFTGREWLIERIDRFIRRHDRGYVVIQAPAGIGKTAVAAWLAAERGWPCHFTRRRKGNVGATALRNLAAQIIAGYQLSDRFTPGGMLPETAGEPGWFDQVLRAGAAAATAAGQKLVVVVDGLDEAETFDGDLPLGLPTRLPRGVIMVVTCRTGSRLLGMRLPWEKTTFELADERNLADMRLFLERTATGDEEIATRLQSAGVTAVEFTAGLLDRCGGVWIYLRYILDALRLDLYSPLEIGELPPDLITYYTEQLLPDDDTDTTRTRLLVTLAAVTEPLTVTVLAELAGLPESEVERLCAERLRPFLTCTVVGDERRYAIYHVSLRDYLHGAYLESMLEADQTRAERLARRCRAAHSRIADRYLESWGGLRAGLPTLAADVELAADHGAYPLRNLVLHLDRAHRDGDLHRLLAADDGGRNLWYAAHDRAGTLVDYVTDLRRVQRLVTAEVDADVAAGRPAQRFGLELRYTMMQAAIVSLTDNIPAPLVTALVENGVWSADRAIEHARRLRSPVARTALLGELSARLPEAERDTILAEATTLAVSLDPAERCWAYLNIVRHHPPPLPAELVVDVLDAAVSARDHPLLVRAFTDLGPHLGEEASRAIAHIATVEPEERRVRLWQVLLPHLGRAQAGEVLSLGRALTSDYGRATLVEAAAAAKDPARVGELLDFARSIGSCDDLAVALAGVSPLLGPTDRPAVIAEALTAARATPEPSFRARALVRIAEVSPDAERAGLLEEARRAAADVPDAVDRVWAMTLLAGHLEGLSRRRVLDQCLDLAGAAASDRDRVTMLTCLLPVADDRAADRICDLIGGIADDQARMEILTNCADDFADDRFDWILKGVREHLDPAARGVPLEVLAERAGPASAARILDEVGRLPSAGDRFRVLHSLAAQLPADLLAAAVDTVRSISDEYGRAQLLAELADRLPEIRPELLQEAVEAARGSENGGRARVLTKVAAKMPEPARAGLLDEALASALEVSRPSWRFFALLNVIDQLDGEARTVPIAEALAAVRDEDFENPRSFGLAEIARLDPVRAPELLPEAVAAARAYRPEGYRPMLLAQLAGRLSEGRERSSLLREGVALARETEAWQQRAVRVSLRMIALLPEPLVVECLAAVDSFSNDRMLAPAVVEVVRWLPEPLIQEAVEAAAGLPMRGSVAMFLGRLIPHLPERPRETALRHVQSVPYAVLARQSVTREATRVWPRRLGPAEVDVIRRCLDGTDLDDCLAVLANALDLLERFAGPGVHQACLESVRLVQRWWPRPAG
jgi:hypothetical protein